MRLLTFVRIIFLTMLCLGTILFPGTFARFETASKNLLHNPDFQDDFAGWQIQSRDSVTVDKGILALSSHPKNEKRTISVMQTIVAPPEQRLLVLSGIVRSSNVIPGEKRWEAARLLLVPITTEGKQRYDVPHGLVQLRGTTPWKEYQHAFRLPKDISSVSVVIQFLNSSGTIEVKSLSLNTATESVSFSIGIGIIAVIWLVAGIWIIWPILSASRGIPSRIAVMIIGCVILAGVLLPETTKHEITPSWLQMQDYTESLSGSDIALDTNPFLFELTFPELDIYKLGHFVLFAMLGAVLMVWRPYEAPLMLQGAILSLFALATESVQVLVAGRGGRLSDLLLDISGALAGALIGYAMRRWLGRKSVPQTHKPN